MPINMRRMPCMAMSLWSAEKVPKDAVEQEILFSESAVLATGEEDVPISLYAQS